jgi:ABC-type Fe3+/spermidine/putrescine transport system ATPase subunit
LPAVTLRQVTKRYSTTPVVDSLDLEVQPGEFLTLLGPSGCGKTTTLRMMAGFVRPSAGRIAIGGIDVTNLPARERNIGMVFQDYALFPHLSVRDNIGFGLVERGASGHQVAARVHELMELIQLNGLEDRLPGQLSGGQQQRVALARAIAHPPQVLLLDEPLGALDLKMREHMQLEVRRIQRELGLTAVYVTHDQTEAMTMSDRIAVMNAGRIEQLDAPEVVYRRPATRFVAEFVGKVNFMMASIHSSTSREHSFSTPAGIWKAPSWGTTFASGQEVSIAVRPEHLQWCHPGTPASGLDNRLEVVVESSIFCGNVTLTTVITDDRSRWLVESHANVVLPAAGQRTTICVAPTEVVVLQNP